MARLDDLRQALLDAYARDPKVGSPNINVTFLEDKVALTGEVATLGAKEEAENLARQIVPGLDVDNSLVITGNRPANDATLAEQATQALRDAGIDLGVKVRDGAAQLLGSAANLDARNHAHRIVSRVPGIRSVRDEQAPIMGQQKIEVEPEYRQEGKFRVPPEAPQVVVGRDDITLTNEIEELLATQMTYPRADEVHVWTHNGTVALDGWVKTAEEAVQAQILAERVSGVKSVQNRLVATDGSTGGDDALNQEIRRAFGKKGDEVSPVDALSVVVQQTAYLWGQVDTPEQRLKAQQLAEQVPGILRVNNNIQVVTRRSRPGSGPGGGPG